MSTQPAPIQFHSRAQVDMLVANKMRRQLGFGRDPKPNLPAGDPLYIFNVSDKPYRWHQPGFKFYEVKACAPDKDYSEPCVVEGIVAYEYLKIDSTSWGFHNGEEICAEILNIGPGKQPQYDLRKQGMFVSRSNPPRQEEIDEARRMLMATCEQLLSEADAIHAEGQKKGLDGQMIGAEHRWAARLTGQSRDWSRPIRQMIDCPKCSSPISINASVHFGAGGCGAVINWREAVSAALKTPQEWLDASPFLKADQRHPDYREKKSKEQ